MHVCIVGAGPVGLLQCLYLIKERKRHNEIKGFRSPMEISIFERRSQQDLIEASTGQRSINLALSWRGMKALEAVGLLQEVLKDSMPMKGRQIHPLMGQLYNQPYSLNPKEVIYSIERIRIQRVLLKAVLDHCIKDEGVKIYFRQQLLRIDTVQSILDFTSVKTVRADLIIGCDGTFSKVRSEMLKHFPGQVKQETFKHQYRELSLPIGTGLSNQYLHIWPRNDFMLIALPNRDGGFTATLFSEMSSIPLEDPSNFFSRYFPDLLELIGEESKFTRDWQNSSANSLLSVSVDPIGSGRIVLLGDAAHSILPFYGQGMNAGFEDVQLFTQKLIEILKVPRLHRHEQLKSTIEKYSQDRISDARAIDSLARENYKEMREQVLSWAFKLEHAALLKLNELFPTLIIPKYSMISFTSIPYSTIKRGEITQNVVIIALILILACIAVFEMKLT